MRLREPSSARASASRAARPAAATPQVVPMEDINLYSTGDFHAITSAHNLLSALIDNHIYWGNSLGFDTRRIAWKRVLDMNDRALREIVDLAGRRRQRLARHRRLRHHGRLEVMAILCLALDLKDLERRLGNIDRRLHARQDADPRPRAQGRRRHDGGAAQGRADAEPGADAGEQPRLRSTAVRSPTSRTAATPCWRRSRR